MINAEDAKVRLGEEYNVGDAAIENRIKVRAVDAKMHGLHPGTDWQHPTVYRLAAIPARDLDPPFDFMKSPSRI